MHTSPCMHSAPPNPDDPEVVHIHANTQLRACVRVASRISIMKKGGCLVTSVCAYTTIHVHSESATFISSLICGGPHVSIWILHRPLLRLESRVVAIPSRAVVLLHVLFHHPGLSEHEGSGDGFVRSLNRSSFVWAFSGNIVEKCARIWVNASTSFNSEGYKDVIRVPGFPATKVA